MRTFVFTYDRYDSITTSQMLEEEHIDHTVLCHTDEQRAQFVAHGRVKPDRLVVTHQPRGLAYNRNAALDMMEDGEWAVFLVDDFMYVEELADYDREKIHGRLPITTANQREWAPRFKRRSSMFHFLQRCKEHAHYAERFDCHLVGFAGFDNPLFRKDRWKINCLADGRAWVVQKTDLRFDEHVQLIDDVAWTALNIERFGAVFVDAWILPKCRRYTGGAFGSIEQRLEQKRTEVSYLMERFPGIVATRKKPGWPDGTHVVIRPARRTR